MVEGFDDEIISSFLKICTSDLMECGYKNAFEIFDKRVKRFLLLDRLVYSSVDSMFRRLLRVAIKHGENA